MASSRFWMHLAHSRSGAPESAASARLLLRADKFDRLAIEVLMRASRLVIAVPKPGPAAMQQLPWALIPTVLVPYWLVAHGIIFAQLRARGMPQR